MPPSAGFRAPPASARSTAINALSWRSRVLEVGVGTGLALPLYDRGKRVTGIDLSARHAGPRAGPRGGGGPYACGGSCWSRMPKPPRFAEASFDIAASMFVASVVPHPRKLLAELRRVVRPGGLILFVNHFVAAKSGPRRFMSSTPWPRYPARWAGIPTSRRSTCSARIHPARRAHFEPHAAGRPVHPGAPAPLSTSLRACGMFHAAFMRQCTLICTRRSDIR